MFLYPPHPSLILFLQTPSHLRDCLPSPYKSHGRGEVFDLHRTHNAHCDGSTENIYKATSLMASCQVSLRSNMGCWLCQSHAQCQERTRNMRDIKDISCVHKSCMFSGRQNVMVATNTNTVRCMVHVFHRHTTMDWGPQVDLCTHRLVVSEAHKHQHTHR